jgi:hypothetical protein
LIAAKNAVLAAASAEGFPGVTAEVDDSAVAFAGGLVGAVADIVGAQLTNDERTVDRFLIRMRGNYPAVAKLRMVRKILFSAGTFGPSPRLNWRV